MNYYVTVSNLWLLRMKQHVSWYSDVIYAFENFRDTRIKQTWPYQEKNEWSLCHWHLTEIKRTMNRR